MKKLTKKEAQEISNKYNLGKVKEIYLIEGGGVNYNFNLKTNKGEFIIRFLGHKINEGTERKFNLEFKVLNFLKEKNFPYKIPFPVENNKRKFLSKFKGKRYWIYKKLEGNFVKSINTKKLKEIAKLIATYHKFVKKLEIKKGEIIYPNIIFDLSWVKEKLYPSIKKIKPKNKTDRLVLDNLKLFESVLDKITNKKFNKNVIPTHSDFNLDNILFKGNKITGLLDFDNLDTLPLIEDIANGIQNYCLRNNELDKEKMKIFLEEYEKTNPLTQKEKEMIIPAILRKKCIEFWWFYSEGGKWKNKYEILKKIVRQTKNLMNYLE